MFDRDRRASRLAKVLGLAMSLASFATLAAGSLKSPNDFKTIGDAKARSIALFTEAGKVIQHPRCLNCHPKGDRPTQGEDLHAHTPPVIRGADGHGAIGMQCGTCHQPVNVESSGVPGNVGWHLAPAEMAWQGRSLGQICEQIKDKKRNGGKSLEQIGEHMAKDGLVGWAWMPGGTREPAPGTQDQFGALIGAWIDSGAHCPKT